MRPQAIRDLELKHKDEKARLESTLVAARKELASREAALKSEKNKLELHIMESRNALKIAHAEAMSAAQEAAKTVQALRDVPYHVGVINNCKLQRTPVPDATRDFVQNASREVMDALSAAMGLESQGEVL